MKTQELKSKAISEIRSTILMLTSYSHNSEFADRIEGLQVLLGELEAEQVSKGTPTEQAVYRMATDYANGNHAVHIGRRAEYHAFIAGFEKAISLQPEWVSVTERLPEVGHVVLVQTAYMDKGKPTTDCFAGYMDEYGDLIVHPTDENYGWEFNDCATHWMPLPQPPTK